MVVLDPLRSSSILKNLHTLHIRMKQHSYNAMFLARKFRETGLPTAYAGLEDHPGHAVRTRMMNKEFGYGGMLNIDLGTAERAAIFMEDMEKNDVGYLAVSLGYFKTLFSNSGKSTSSEVPEDIQHDMGMSEGLVRYSVGLDNDIERTWDRIVLSLKKVDVIK